MRTIVRRIGKLQDRLLLCNEHTLRIWVLTKPGCEFALDLGRCVQILDECGFRPTARFGVLNFCGIPAGLSGEELEKFLRERCSGMRH